MILLQLSVGLILGSLDLPAIIDLFDESINSCLFSFDLFLELSKQFVLLLNYLGVISELHIFTMEFLDKLDFVSQELVIVFSLSPELIVDVLVGSLDHLLIGQQVLDFIRLLTVKLVLQSFVSDLSLRLELGLQLFVLTVGELLLLCKFLAGIVQLLGDFGEHFDLNVQELDLDLHVLDTQPKLGCLRQGVLVVLHSEEVFFDLGKVFLKA